MSRWWGSDWWASGWWRSLWWRGEEDDDEVSTPLDALQALRVPGRLSIGPFTSLTADYPHGGTALGLCGPARFRRTRVRRAIRAEEYGGGPVELVEGAIAWEVAFPMRGLDDDGLAVLTSGTFVGASGGRRGLRESPSTVRAGALASTRARVLLFTPDDVDRHRGVLFFRALPAEDLTELDFGHGPEQQLVLRFLAVPDASDRVVEVQLLEDMTAPS